VRFFLLAICHYMHRYDHEIVYLQKTIRHFDMPRCKAIASWLAEYINTLEADERLYHISIQQLHLSNRTLNILQSNKITTVGQLMKRSADWDNIRRLKGAGEKVLREIKEKLAAVQSGQSK
jgi:DNA-directed RNA polymerase alpha subunit